MAKGPPKKPPLPSYHLVKDEKKGGWKLEQEGADRGRRRFENKAEATKGDVLEKAVGPAGGSVKIHKTDGEIQEERTFPGSRDPKNSPG